MTKRLFVFGGYHKDGIIDDTVLYYLQRLSELGDIVFNMDNELSDFELSKIAEIPNILLARGERHGEYDFGSYKRGYAWAKENDVLKNYDWAYLVNDSVYGPLKPLEPILKKLESKGKDCVGMYYCKEGMLGQYLQSWFMGFKPVIHNSDWFKRFLQNIKKYETKDEVVINCEYGFSKELKNNNIEIATFITDTENNDLFRNPIRTLRKKLPFIKKSQIALQNMGNSKKMHFYIPKHLKNIINGHIYSNNLCVDKYKFIFGFNVLWVPILEVYEKYAQGNWPVKYKVVLFRCLPILWLRIKKNG